MTKEIVAANVLRLSEMVLHLRYLEKNEGTARTNARAKSNVRNVIYLIFTLKGEIANQRLRA